MPYALKDFINPLGFYDIAFTKKIFFHESALIDIMVANKSFVLQFWKINQELEINI